MCPKRVDNMDKQLPITAAEAENSEQSDNNRLETKYNEMEEGVPIDRIDSLARDFLALREEVSEIYQSTFLSF